LPAGVDALLVTLAVLNPSLAYVSAAVATVGSVAGCMILFYLARKGGQRYLDKSTQSGRARYLRAWFLRYGLATVFVPALLPIPLPTKVFVLSAGALGVGAAPFLLVVLAARIPRYFGLAYLGSHLGAHSAVWLRSHVWQLTAVAVLLMALLMLLIRLTAPVSSSR
jgi:membrane protein YqaA with SNARE-associated domain